MPALIALKAATTLSELADLLGYEPKKLSYILYKKSDSAKYSSFTIPKKTGGLRHIDAPAADLKLVQKRLAKLIQDCSDEIRLAQGTNIDGLNPDQISHGFRRGRSIGTNALRHRHKRLVFNIDLADFFPSCNFGRVRGILIKDKNFELNAKVASAIAHIACYKGALPQGSPSSPCLANLIAHVLDIHLTALAKKSGCVYSRYADDLTFSTNKKEMPKAISVQGESDAHQWLPGAELIKTIGKCGFSINPAKTRMQYRNCRQEVTGLVVNQRVNVRREYRHTVRAMVHRVLKTGSFEHIFLKEDSIGKPVKTNISGELNELQGMLGFIDSIDRKYRPDDALEGPGNKKKKLSAYGHFILFRNFYAAKSPVILCEGKTDNIYLTHAIRKLAPAFPNLASTLPGGVIELLVRCYKYSGKNTGITVGLVGGSGDLCNFIHMYKKAIATYEAPGLSKPVILLVDDDDGGRAVMNAAAGITKKKTPAAVPFLHVCANLYLVWTPTSTGAKSSCIEDFFDATTKAKTINGKTFDPGKDADTDTTYSKAVFAYKVVEAHADKIDFSGFAPILQRITEAIAFHNTLTSPLP